MEIPAKVLVYCPLLDVKGTAGTLVAVRAEGFYELQLPSQGRVHTVLAPVAQTTLVFAEAAPEVPPIEIER